MAIASLSLVIASPMFAVLALLLELPLYAPLALFSVIGLILAHVAYFRIRASKGALTGFGFAAAAMAIGYITLVIGAGLFVVVYFMMQSIGRWSHT